VVGLWLLLSLVLSVEGLSLAYRLRDRVEATATAPDSEVTRAAREAMVTRQIEARGVKSPAVLAAMRKVPRHAFVPPEQAGRAYLDRPLPIGHEQTISQPYIVALMTELAAVGKGARVLEIGTGSGYQAAVLAELGAKVYSIEIVEPLGRQAAATLQRLGYETIETRIGDGYRGWPEAAPFDAIVVTAAPPTVPQPLLRQLAPGGRLVVPVGDDSQELKVITRTGETWTERNVAPVRFVPMVGEAGGRAR
jgi:protein-L-isoaspartate(D-aspartate) O-methyltransferase